MLIARLPSNEEMRLQDLESLEILDTSAEKEFDDIVELAAQICNCPVSLISLLDKDRQWFKAVKGIPDSETRRDISFCSHSILQDEVMVIEDAWEDERFMDNPLVTGDPRIRFYAGTPILSPAGHRLGAVCVIDHKPNKLSEAQCHSLVLMSRQVTRLLELRAQNLQIRRKAEELLDLKSQAIHQSIRQQEQEKQHIARVLHENLAQTVAASSIYLNMAMKDEDKRLSLVEDSQAQLQDLLGTMRSLSNAINPSALHIMPFDLLLQDFIMKKKDTLPFSLELTSIHTLPVSEPEQAISMIRIVEQWLQMIVRKQQVTAARIKLSLQDTLDILLEDNGQATERTELEKQLVTSLVYDRVKGMKGRIALLENKGHNILYVSLPFLQRRIEKA